MKAKLIDAAGMAKLDNILNKWSGKLTWDDFAVSVAGALGKSSISKFTLMKYPSIKQAFERRKATLREAKSEVIVSLGDVTLDMLIHENAQLRNQVLHLNSELKLRESLWANQFRRWQYNLSQMPGVDLSRLDQALPATRRE